MCRGEPEGSEPEGRLLRVFLGDVRVFFFLGGELGDVGSPRGLNRRDDY